LYDVTEFHTRHLPHLHAVGQPMFITWRLQGSLPAGRSFPKIADSGKAFVAVDRVLDTATTGPLYLRMPEIAGTVQEAILYRDQREYHLHAHVIMPNHVHLLVTPLHDVSKMMHSLKGFTARECNRILGFTGRTFWQNESYDRLVRTPTEFDRIVNYIEMNPVKAGLAMTPEEFRWSSARRTDSPPQADSLPYNLL
jgi:REP element-mobilizing transposase RayT